LKTMNTITLHGKLIITGEIEAVTGLHIGGAAAGLDIGGIDNPIIRHPITREPYIPGSSLRGKMRGWLDRYYGKDLNKYIRRETPEVRVHECESQQSYAACAVCQLFGITPGVHKDFANLMPTRLIVRDVHLRTGDERGSLGWLTKAKTDLPFTEVKWEAAIDRITAAAVPRQNERVPAGAVFAPFEMLVNLYGAGDVNYLPVVFKAMELLEDDYLGGYGSRGAGKISFRNLTVTLRTHAYYDQQAPESVVYRNPTLAGLRTGAAEVVQQVHQALGG
jgi:CRISPR-associated protein Csm3